MDFAQARSVNQPFLLIDIYEVSSWARGLKGWCPAAPQIWHFTILLFLISVPGNFSEGMENKWNILTNYFWHTECSLGIACTAV